MSSIGHNFSIHCAFQRLNKQMWATLSTKSGEGNERTLKNQTNGARIEDRNDSLQ